eukprot:4466469-Amphidinium_carterae.1
MEAAIRECSLEAVSGNFEARDCPPCSHATLGKRSTEAVREDMEFAHRTQTAPWEGSLEAVCGNREARECTHRSEATLGKRSIEAVREDTELAHRPHHLESGPRECTLEAVSMDCE